MTPVLAVDLGKTGCRGSLRVDGEQAVLVEAEGAPGLANTGGVAAAARAVRTVIDRIAARTGDLTVSVGAAGAASAPDAARQLARELGEIEGVRQVAVTSDAVTAHAGALGGACGVVLAMGTGVVATAIDTAGNFTRVDGWGPLLGDEGSGGWIGLEGLRAVLRAHDGRGPVTELTGKVGERYRVSVDELPRYLGAQASPASVAARFAPTVAACAATDAVAAHITATAGQALARTVLTAIERAGLPRPVPYAIVGGLVGLGAALLDPLDTATAGAVERRTPFGDPIDGAALLALDPTTVFEPLLTRVSTPG
ncbi:BadF/BadG/BcrA/BcrD ATPase family protein [Nocardia callitridis]|uniref:BadF/BadG/BcrA/BcrD ATPase family protein n=1 Tax=Nocardia callitridis TaxID=648753 RepID=A0ABP9KTV6_9NOCA